MTTKTRRKAPARRAASGKAETPPPGDRYLGEVPLKIVGTQYCDVTVRPGEIVHFEREHENRHDRNAIRVDNDDFAPVGHIPRQEARWIAPLLDDGRLKIDGRIPENAVPGRYDAPLLLNLYLTAKGAGALEHFERCRTEQQALHEVVLGAWERSAAWTSRRQIIGVGRTLAKALGREALPESFLVIRMLQIRARELAEERRRESLERVRRTIRRLRVGKGSHFQGLTLFPLFGDNGHDPAYVLLSEALENGLAEVTEVSDEGSVPELKVISRCDRPILIPSGEIVSGGKQNRVINITIIVESFTELLVPVTCVEEGRWGDRGERFRVTHFAAPSLRSAKAAGVLDSVRSGGGAQSDQGEVWNQVADTLDGVGALSETGSFTESYERVAGRIDAYRKKLGLEAGALGFLVVSGETVLGVEIFDSASTLAALWPRLSESYFLEGVLRGKRAKKALRKTANRFLAELSAGTAPESASGAWPGQLTVETPTHVGGGLVYRDDLCHVGAFIRVGRDGRGGSPDGTGGGETPDHDGEIGPGPDIIY